MRLIDADALLERFNRKVGIWTVLLDEDTAGDLAFNCKLADAIEEMPTIEAEPVRHGRWIPMYELTREGILPDEPMGYMCDQCNAKRKKRLNYCPNCGAKMDQE